MIPLSLSSSLHHPSCTSLPDSATWYQLGHYSTGPKPSMSSHYLPILFKLFTPVSSQIFSQTDLSLHFSAQHSVGLRRLSLRVAFRSRGIYPLPTTCMRPLTTFQLSGPVLFLSLVLGTLPLHSRPLFRTVSSMWLCFPTSASLFIPMLSCLLSRHLHPCWGSPHHSSPGYPATSTMKNDCGSQIIAPEPRIVPW